MNYAYKEVASGQRFLPTPSVCTTPQIQSQNPTLSRELSADSAPAGHPPPHISSAPIPSVEAFSPPCQDLLPIPLPPLLQPTNKLPMYPTPSILTPALLPTRARVHTQSSLFCYTIKSSAPLSTLCPWLPNHPSPRGLTRIPALPVPVPKAIWLLFLPSLPKMPKNAITSYTLIPSLPGDPRLHLLPHLTRGKDPCGFWLGPSSATHIRPNPDSAWKKSESSTALLPNLC